MAAPVAERPARKEAVSKEDFLKAYIKAYKAGQSNEDLANTLNMNEASVTSRASALRKQLAEKNVKLPYLKSQRGAGGVSLDEAAELVKSLLGEDEETVEE